MYEGERDDCFKACCHGWEGGRPLADVERASEIVFWVQQAASALESLRYQSGRLSLVSWSVHER